MTVVGSLENEDKIKKIASEIDAILSKGPFQIKQWHSSNKNVDQADKEHVDFLGKNGIRFERQLPLRKLKLLQRRSLLQREIASPTWPRFGIPQTS